MAWAVVQQRHCIRCAKRDFCIENLLVRIHFIIVMNRWTGLAVCEFELLFGSATAFGATAPNLSLSLKHTHTLSLSLTHTHTRTQTLLKNCRGPFCWVTVKP